ncbi:YbjQ family protein [Halobacillus seohaensis]|uniref:UPF0145 protein ACFQIC_18055 n=1 Tax=Halobacillus seohaensis TaxID=447421 RepID=A0ABW2ENI5_9BACI
MIIVNTDYIPGYEITEVLGIAQGNIVQSKHLGRDFMAGLKTVVGGEIKGYTDMLTEARKIADERLIQEAEELKADAIINIRYTTSQVMQGSSELLAYGTAVKIKKV